MYQGSSIQLKAHSSRPEIAELVFDLKGESTNRFNALTLSELKEAYEALTGPKGKWVKGLLVRSAKDAFIVGADITEFSSHFARPDAEFLKWMRGTQDLFSQYEDLPYPVIAAVGGFALGGGFEFALTAHYRVCSPQAKVGLPETKLGIFPGWGGTVRLSRLIGGDNAIEWIASGRQVKVAEALSVGAIDAIAAAPDAEALEKAALKMMDQALLGKLDWKSRTALKKARLKLGKVESMMTFQGSKSFVASQAGPNYPAPLAAIEVMEKGATLTRDEAMKIEAETFVKIAKTPQTAALVGVFLGDQFLKKKAKKASSGSAKVEQIGVLGAGIMGGGIAYQTASSSSAFGPQGISVVMKDIKKEALDLGMSEATKLLEKRLAKGQLKPTEMAVTLSRIHPTLSMDALKTTDFVVEAVVELEKVKKAVLKEVEAVTPKGAILTSNTSTISITELATALERPDQFCGMHFFNPVHRMPLVEVIRGKKSSEKTISTVVAVATAMGKSAIVVNDCPGFFVNRVLFPYFGAFFYLMKDGVPFERIDKVMEKFGWPMGPAYLLDVVGIDTAHHCLDVMREGYPDRMNFNFKSVLDVMYEAKRYGQKNGKGFFNYAPDPKGRPQKTMDPAVTEMLKPVMGSTGADITDEAIVDRMMLAMILECSRCLEEGIVDTATEVDLGLLYGLGFPPFRGGALRYADQVGLEQLLAKAEKYTPISGLYKPTEQLKKYVSQKRGFHG